MLMQQFQQHLKTAFPFLQPAQKILLAVSGGIDSVVMTDLFFKSGFDFAVAHFNFQLREDESDRDEDFVKALASTYNKEFFIRRFDTQDYADEHKISIQEAARNLRYSWFDELRNTTSNNKQFLATAHNADDNIETALLFFFRGTGIHGLTGIQQFDKQRKLIRPLLFASRNDIKMYAEQNDISWVEDASNATDKYARNYLRHHIIPSSEKIFPSLKQNITGNISRLKETEILYNQSIELYKKKLLEINGNEVHIPVLKLRKVQPLDTILWEIFKAYNFHPQQLNEIKKLFDADNSSYVQSFSHKIIKNRNWLIVAENKTNEAEFILIEEEDKQVHFKNGLLQIEKFFANSQQLKTNSLIAQLDAKNIRFPLLLRKWKTGDYFYPLGMKKKKKLSRFFIDQKLSSTQKENVWILESNKKIIWIIGYRIDERFKILPSTKAIISITALLK